MADAKSRKIADTPPLTVPLHLPRPLDLRFNWVEADLAALDPAEAREFVVDAWRMVMPTKLSRTYDLTHPDGPG